MECSLKKHRNDELVNKLRKGIQDVIPPNTTDEYLMRFLKFKNFDVRKAEKYLRYVFNVRSLHRFDELPAQLEKDKPEPLKKYEFTGFLGFDKNENPIRYIASGNGDFIGFLQSLSTFYCVTYCAANIESDLQAAREYYKMLGIVKEPNITVIFDLENFNLLDIAHKLVIETGFDALRMYQENNPGLVSRILVINAPPTVSVAFNIFKPVLRMDIISKITLASKENSPAVLLRYIDANVLPVFLGGNRVDENNDSMCSSFLTFGGKIPTKYYAINQRPWLSELEEDVEIVTIPAKESFDYKLHICKPNTLVRIEMWSDNSIGLSIHYKKSLKEFDGSYDEWDESKEEAISPYSKIQCHIVPVNHIVNAWKPGTYIFRFDNTFSWFHTKRIVFRIRPDPLL